jgi:hypothetical protein
MVRLSRQLVVTVATIATGAAAVGAAICGPALASAAAPPSAARPVVLVNCADKAVVRPGQFVLTCADANDLVTGLHWVSWRGVAFGSGTEHVNDCVPNCAAGRTFSYPVLITLWRPQARPGHPGQRFFSRLTEIRTGRLHKAKDSTLSRTQTFQLWGSIG